MTLSTRKAILGAVLAAVVLAAGLLFVGKRSRPYDPTFDTRVATPAYSGGGPVVLYDEGHRNTHSADGGYKPLADLLRNDGYELRILDEPVSAQALEGVAVFVSVLPRGANDANDDPAFTDSEIGVLDTWVRGGGSLLLVTDHWPYGAAAASLADRFGVEMGQGLVEDPTHHDPERGESHLVFSDENGLLRDHPIVRGRDPGESVSRVLTFTGQSLQGPPGAVPFLALAESAIEYPPAPPRVDREGGDVRVNMEYGDPVSAAGKAQGLALEHGQGRIVVLGEAGMLRAQREKGDDRVGMNVRGIDNRLLALNILHWLSRVI